MSQNRVQNALSLKKTGHGIGVPDCVGGRPPLISGFFTSIAWLCSLWVGRVGGPQGSTGAYYRYANSHGPAHPDWRWGSGKLNRLVGE